MNRRLHNNKGMAMLMTLLTVALLYTVSLHFNRSMRNQVVVAANLKESLIMGTLARSGVVLAQAILDADGKESDIDSLQEKWALKSYVTDAASQVSTEARIELAIEDLSGKIQINSLAREENGEWKYDTKQREVLLELLRNSVFELEEEEVNNILEAIKDWIDADDETEFGAETSYYSSLPVGYPCKNGPLTFIEELLLVRGITTRLFFGTKETPGLAQFITVHGEDGKINVNTADALVLQALSPDITKKMLEELLRYRENSDNDLSTTDWLKKALPGDVADHLPGELIAVKSSYFVAHATAGIDSNRRDVTAVMRRMPPETPVIITMRRGDGVLRDDEGALSHNQAELR